MKPRDLAIVAYTYSLVATSLCTALMVSVPLALARCFFGERPDKHDPANKEIPRRRAGE